MDDKHQLPGEGCDKPRAPRPLLRWIWLPGLLLILALLIHPVRQPYVQTAKLPPVSAPAPHYHPPSLSITLPHTLPPLSKIQNNPQTAPDIRVRIPELLRYPIVDPGGLPPTTPPPPAPVMTPAPLPFPDGGNGRG